MTEKERIEIYRGVMPRNMQIEDLESLGFFKAPASTKYHGAYEGGLFDHSLAVTQALVDLTEKLGLKWNRIESPFIVGMYHDLCKVESYYFDIETESYKYNGDMWLDGHGTKSVILTEKYLRLTEEEIACIRWHMGAYETDTTLWNYYGRAIEEFPNVLYTHTADMIASKIKKV